MLTRLLAPTKFDIDTRLGSMETEYNADKNNDYIRCAARIYGGFFGCIFVYFDIRILFALFPPNAEMFFDTYINNNSDFQVFFVEGIFLSIILGYLSKPTSIIRQDITQLGIEFALWWMRKRDKLQKNFQMFQARLRDYRVRFKSYMEH